MALLLMLYAKNKTFLILLKFLKIYYFRSTRKQRYRIIHILVSSFVRFVDYFEIILPMKLFKSLLFKYRIKQYISFHQL